MTVGGFNRLGVLVQQFFDNLGNIACWHNSLESIVVGGSKNREHLEKCICWTCGTSSEEPKTLRFNFFLFLAGTKVATSF